MSPSKKKKRPSAGEELIASLYEDVSPSKGPRSPKSSGQNSVVKVVNEVFGGNFDLANDFDDKTPPPQPSNELVLNGDDANSFALESSQPVILDPVAKAQKENSQAQAQSVAQAKDVATQIGPKVAAAPSKPAQSLAPPFKGGQPVVTQMMQRPAPTPVDSQTDDGDDDRENSVGNWSPDYGALSAPEPYEPSPEFLNAKDESTGTKAPPQPAPAAQATKVAAQPSSASEEERTMRLVSSKNQSEVERPPFDPMPTQALKPQTQSRSIDRAGATEIRAGIKIPPAPKFSGASVTPGAFSSSEATLKQSESLRIAQGRITELERELERLRRDNESLSTAGDTLRRRADELLSKTESLDIQAREATHLLEEERRIMRGQLQAKDRDNAEMRARVEEIETRLESNFKKIRVRERELEHRLEIVKMESATLVSTKDKMILDLKRQIDQLTHEHDYAKTKTQELFNQYKEKQETQRRVVRALRIALTILEGEDDSVAPIKKAE
jgi:hypothetical protein